MGWQFDISIHVKLWHAWLQSNHTLNLEIPPENFPYVTLKNLRYQDGKMVPHLVSNMEERDHCCNDFLLEWEKIK